MLRSYVLARTSFARSSYCRLATTQFISWQQIGSPRSTTAQPMARDLATTSFKGRLELAAETALSCVGEPIDEEVDPFVHGGIASLKPLAHNREWAHHIFSTTCAPIHRIGLDWKAVLRKTPIARGM
jgi:hypothetical protein